MILGEEDEIHVNILFYTYEFSATQWKDGAWNINPATRIGNCVRTVQMDDVFGPAGVDMLEMSFPALKGASGAPVIEIQNSRLIVRGIIVANAERHLLPAQIETVLDAENHLLEERKYFLPQAAAVHSQHLVRLVDQWLARSAPGL
jgi:hypothetical protein